MDRARWVNIGIAAGIGLLGCVASVVGAATLLHSDDGLHVLAGVFYGVPVACLAAGFVAGSRSESRPTLDGLAAAELGWTLACLAVLIFLPFPGFVGAIFLFGQVGFLPVWAFGAFGGWAGGRLARVVQSLRRPS